MTDNPSTGPYIETDIQRAIGSLEENCPWMLKWIEFEKADDETVEAWIREAIRRGGTGATKGYKFQTEAEEFTDRVSVDVEPQTGYDPDRNESANIDILTYIHRRLSTINSEISFRVPVPVEIPEEVWKRARFELQHHREPDEPIDTGDNWATDTIMQFVTLDYQWYVDGVPLTEMSFDDDEVDP